MAALCGTASADEVHARTDYCARVGTFANIALSQVKNREIPLHSTYVYRKFAVNTPMAATLAKGESMMQTERKTPRAVAGELQDECEKSRTHMAAIAPITLAQSSY